MKEREGSQKSIWTKVIVERCLLGWVANWKNGLLLFCGTCWKIDNEGDHMMNEPQHQPPSVAVDISFLVQGRDVVSGIFSWVSRPSLVLTAFIDCESSYLSLQV